MSQGILMCLKIPLDLKLKSTLKCVIQMHFPKHFIIILNSFSNFTNLKILSFLMKISNQKLDVTENIFLLIIQHARKYYTIATHLSNYFNCYILSSITDLMMSSSLK